MNALLDWINPEEFPTLVVLIGLLIFTARQMVRPDSLVYRQASRLAGATIVLYAALGIHAWGLSSARDLLVLLIRAILAAGVAFGISTLILAVVHHVVGDPMTAMASTYRQWTAEYHRRLAEEQARRQAAEAKRREREENARRAPILERERRRQADEAARVERERHARTDEARAEVIGFYDGHAELLAESLPSSLFKSQLQTRLPETITPDQAWQAVQEMIGEMLPLIAAARERVHADEEQAREQERHVQRVRREIHRLEEEIQKITQSSSFEPDVSDPEIRALQDQIRELREDLEVCEDRPLEHQP